MVVARPQARGDVAPSGRTHDSGCNREWGAAGGVRASWVALVGVRLGVSRGVVSDAYAQLTEQGFLITRRRCAPVIAPGCGGKAVSAAPRAAKGAVAHVRYDLSPLVPDVRLFPLGRWLASGRRATQHVSAEVLGFREHRGERELREVLADHLGRTRGVIAEPEQVVVTQGSGHSIDLLLRVLRGARG